MVSMVETASHPGHNDTVMDSVVPKSEPLPDGSISSTVSTPDAEAEPLTQDTTQTQKRKGGRKPVRHHHQLANFVFLFFSFSFFYFLGLCLLHQRCNNPGPRIPLPFLYRSDMLPLRSHWCLLYFTAPVVAVQGSLAHTFLDLCYLGGTEATQPTSSGCLPRTSYGVHSSAGDYHQAQ